MIVVETSTLAVNTLGGRCNFDHFSLRAYFELHRRNGYFATRIDFHIPQRLLGEPLRLHYNVVVFRTDARKEVGTFGCGRGRSRETAAGKNKLDCCARYCGSGRINHGT